MLGFACTAGEMARPTALRDLSIRKLPSHQMKII